MSQIMIAVDGSPASLEAVRRAVALVHQGWQVQVALVHVQAPASLLQMVTQDADDIANAAVDAGEHLMHPAMQLLQEAGIAYTSEVVLGDPGSMLVDMAEQLDVDMVLVGDRGQSAWAEVLVGSVSKTVLRQCARPVLLVKLPPPVGDEEVLPEAEPLS